MTPLSPARPLGSARRRAAVLLSAVALSACVSLSGIAAVPAFATDTTSYTGIILGVGADESQRIVTWYTSTDSAQVVQVAPTASLANGAFPADSVTFTATGTANIASSGGYNRHAVITGLKENTSYSYRVGSTDGGWSTPAPFATQSFDGPFDFLFFGDPQIGSSGDIAKDGAGWADTLDVATTNTPKAELLVSGGDQVDSANNETQWDAFLGSDKLRQYPWAATIGNHDVGGKAYEQHFSTPNTDKSAKFYQNGTATATTSGGDYWYIYKDVLFIDLNSNSYQAANGSGGDAAHTQYVTDVINAHGAEAKYKVLVYHHSIYSPADHAKDGDNKVRRVDFPTVFSNLGVNLVLQGHDHSYSRSYEIKNGAKAVAGEQPGTDEVFPGPGGVIYVTANSASGSKYYDITAPDSSGTSGAGNGADPLDLSKYWYNSVQNQEHVRSYVKVSVQNDALQVQDIRSGTCAAPNAAVEKGNVVWCGPNKGVDQAKPVGSIVDQVTIHPNHGNGQDIQVAVPDAPVGDFGWTIDGHNGLVNLGAPVANATNDYYEATGHTNTITVADTRRSKAPWSVSGSVSDFRDGTKTFSGKYLGWTPWVTSGGAGATAGSPVGSGYEGGNGLKTSSTLGSAVQGHPRGTAQLRADLDLKFPTEVDKGSYRTTMTITALSN